MTPPQQRLFFFIKIYATIRGINNKNVTGGLMSVSRLDKIICDGALVTRSEARRLIKSGCVTVNGKTVTKIDEKCDFMAEKIALSGRVLKAARERYYMLNKPAGVLSATKDSRQKTVLDLFPPELRGSGVFPVGRLDKDTTGLLLITSDGEFCHSVTSPKRRIKKLYEAYVDGQLTECDAKAFKNGLVLCDGTEYLPAELEIDESDTSHAYVTVFEGKYHQVKRMLAAVGKPVLCLKRLSIGNLELDKQLQPGEYRELTEDEKSRIFI